MRLALKGKGLQNDNDDNTMDHFLSYNIYILQDNERGTTTS